MSNFKIKDGQTLIETAIVLLLLLIILIGIAEFARAWHIKNSLKNAVRQGARVAVVTSAGNITTSFSCINSTVCPNSDPIINAVCCQPGVPKTPPGTGVTVTCADTNNNTITCANITSGGSVTVSGNTTITFVLGDSPWPWSRSRSVFTNATMRYEE